MNDVVTEQIVETPSGVVVEAVAPEAPTSITDHAKQFSPAAQKAAAEVETETPDLKPIRPVDQQKRDQGKFAEGRKPMKAKDAVDRINQLTGRAKSAEEKLAAAEAELTRLRTSSTATPAQIERAETRVERAEQQTERRAPAPKNDPEPQETDQKYGGDFGKYLADHARWSARDEYRQIEHARAEQAKQAKREQSYQQSITSWGQRVESAKAKYQDFEQVAFAPVPWAQGSAVDAFIMEDDNGPEVLYYLSHPNQRQEVGDLLRLPPLKQLSRLVALSQRFSPPTTVQAGSTGSVASRQTVVPPPRPPNPVRTEAQRASGTPPPTDGSLSIAEHSRQFKPTRR